MGSPQRWQWLLGADVGNGLLSITGAGARMAWLVASAK
jgi:hypothetical protein